MPMPRYPAPLPADEQIALCVAAQAGDAAARRRLIETTLPFVASRAWRFAKRTHGADIDDFVGDGVIGLIRAMEKFDPAAGCRFVTYAKPWIDQAIRSRGVAFVRGIRASDIGRSSHLTEYRRHRAAGASHKDAVARVSENYGGSSEAAEAIIQSLRGRKHASLDAPIGDEEGECLYDVVPAREMLADERIAQEAFRREVREAVESFSAGCDPRERAILRGRFLCERGEEETFQAIADRFGCARQRIHQIEQKLTIRLRHRLAETWFGREAAEASHGRAPKLELREHVAATADGACRLPRRPRRIPRAARSPATPTLARGQRSRSA